MNLVQKQFVGFVKGAINEEKIYINKKEILDWEKIIDLADQHQVGGLIYSALSQEAKDSIDKELLEYWKRNVFMSGVIQQRHIKEVERVLKAFNDANVEVLVLKGLVIRDLYPNPSLRTMGDSDLLVKSEEYEKARAVQIGRAHV